MSRAPEDAGRDAQFIDADWEAARPPRAEPREAVPEFVPDVSRVIVWLFSAVLVVVLALAASALAVWP